MVNENENKETFVLYYIDNNGKTKYLKSYNIKSVKYKLDKYYFKFTTNVNDAKVWKTENGAYRVTEFCLNPYILNNKLHFGVLQYKNVSKRIIRLEKLKELGFHEQ